MDMIFVIRRFTVDVCVVRVNNFSKMEMPFFGYFLISVVIDIFICYLIHTQKQGATLGKKKGPLKNSTCQRGACLREKDKIKVEC